MESKPNQPTSVNHAGEVVKISKPDGGSHKTLVSAGSSGSLKADNRQRHERSQRRGSKREDRDSKGHRSKPAETPGAVSSRGSDHKKSRGSGSGRSRDARPGARAGSASEDRSRRKNDRHSGGSGSRRHNQEVGARSASASEDRSRRKEGKNRSRSGSSRHLGASAASASEDRSRRKQDRRGGTSRSGSSRSAGASSALSSEDRSRRKQARGQGGGGSPSHIAPNLAANTDNEIAANNEDSEIRAILVNEEEDDTTTRGDKKTTTLQEMEERLQAQFDERLQAQEDVRAQEDAQRSRSKRKCWIIFGFLLLCAAGGGAAYYFLTRDSKEVSLVATDAPTEASVSTPTSPPSEVGGVSTTAPTTSVPSGSPTINFVYGPPSSEDCEAIANGNQAEGQETMTRLRFELDLDVIPSSTTDRSTLAELVQEKLKKYLNPYLTGCSVDVNRKLRFLVNETTRARRKLNEGYRYGIANADIEASLVNGQTCDDTSIERCDRIKVTIDAVAKGSDVEGSVVTGLIAAFFESEADINALELDGKVVSIRVALLGRSDPTTSPSESPSNVPTTLEPTPELTTMSPTRVTTGSPTVETAHDTTGSPTAVETTAQPTSPPTPAPVAGPTLNPTPGPTPSPTPPPTPSPTPEPTPGPTFAPAPGPTPVPTPPPTAVPSEEPSSDPSSRPSLRPSSEPSSEPSSAPSSNPSQIPTLVPTPSPTPSPTPGPTASPTPLPTPNPTPPPTASPTPLPTPNPTFQPSVARSTNPSFSGCVVCSNGADSACYAADSSTKGCSSCVGFRACAGMRDVPVGSNSCVGEIACQYTYAIDENSNVRVAIGDNSCNARAACIGMGKSVTPFDNSCNAPGACNNFHGTMGNGSCNCEDCCRCLPSNSVVPNNSCNSIGQCCDSNGWPLQNKIGAGACTLAEDSCSNLQTATIGSGSCVGSVACKESSMNVGSNSCIGAQACYQTRGRAGQMYAHIGFGWPPYETFETNEALIGNDSCNGSINACSGNLRGLAVGNNSCNGNYACHGYTHGGRNEKVIGNNSCNCPNCCLCLRDLGRSVSATVPDNSCNSLAPDADSIDWVNGGNGPYNHCCTA
eukprot:CAMPEP_0113639816 /NCGR_PEP_ID=MMETSP0017_2-20120614/20896_1 /TAXON_ID=2856 /ORGANISM="Cylindrotheca closterium" /LENGTH=1088 /DNA_ID=CAMNT_0000551065 /DNA_START=17 /DNA_END=3283 /DNA_ORIENTATION=- /assembly_acc=CAM_ASM_000147